MDLKSCRKRAIYWIAAIMLLTGPMVWTGCGNGKGQAGPPPVPKVGTVTLQTQPVELTTELPGRTSAYQVADIRPQVNGLIQKCLFKEGSDVKAGQQLYQIDPALFQVRYSSTRASLAKAQANLPSIQAKAERYRELIADRAVSQQDVDDAAAALAQARADIAYWEAAVEAARIDLEYTRVNAPFSGRIGRSHIKTGSLVTAYQPQPLATLQQLDPIYVDVVQSSAELLRLRRNLQTGLLSSEADSRKKVGIVLEDGTPYPLEGTLQFSDVTVDPTTGSYSLRIIVPNPDHVLLPGMFVRAIVTEGIAQQALLVPQQGVSRTPKGEPAALIMGPDNTVQQRLLTLDRAIHDQWLVASGLAAGDRLIVEGMLNVRPGAKATPVALDPTGEEPGTQAGSDAPPASKR